MSVIVYYLIISLLSIGVFLTGFFVYKEKRQKLFLLLKVYSLIFAFFFLCRYMLGTEAIQDMFQLGNTPIESPLLNVFAVLLVWFTYIGNLVLCLYAFFKIKRLNSFVSYISLPMTILNAIFLNFAFTCIMGPESINTFSVRGIFFAIEIGIGIGYSSFVCFYALNNFVKTYKKKIKKVEPDPIEVIYASDIKNSSWAKFCVCMKKSWRVIQNFFSNHWFDIFIVFVLFLSVMPSYTLQGLFGNVRQVYSVKDFEIPHRIIIYVGIILPVIVHYTLRNKSYEEKKFYLLYICLGTLTTFSLNFRFEQFLNPVTWPLHLCNTAMYIMPIVLIFNMKKFFYFTYFINVLGAFFAMIMPNYGDDLNMFSARVVEFYFNHYIAFFMPLLFVSLGMFKRPKFKEFIYSFIAFAGYFIVVLFVNAIFSGLYEKGLVSQTTDFFFLNSDFIADKLGKWAEDLRNITAVFTVKGVNIVIYPVYQVLFFLVYVALGFGMWFIYEQGYALADNFAIMESRKKKIKLSEYALMNYLNGRSIKEPMLPENKDKLILDNFSKKYGNSDVFAVKDANLEVHGGEIFGFLGPNGAGKSTIIKTVVGIQPITSGRICVCGYDLETQGVEAKRQIGYVPDHYALYEKLTGREYINYIADLYNVSLEDRNKRIDNFVERFELQGSFDNQMKTYSHGMKQKIAIMSALVHNPKIWILDEPLTGLDPNSIFQVKECMKEHAKAGNIVFFSSHIIDVVERICDRIAIIKKGNILCTTTVEEIEKNGDTLEHFYMSHINGKDYLEKYSVDEGFNLDKLNQEDQSLSKEKNKTKKEKSKNQNIKKLDKKEARKQKDKNKEKDKNKKSQEIKILQNDVEETNGTD